MALTMPAPRQRTQRIAHKARRVQRRAVIAAFRVAAARMRSNGRPCCRVGDELGDAERDEVVNDRTEKRRDDRIDPAEAAEHPRAACDQHCHDEDREGM